MQDVGSELSINYGYTFLLYAVKKKTKQNNMFNYRSFSRLGFPEIAERLRIISSDVHQNPGS